jgi:hypothetical protein
MAERLKITPTCRYGHGTLELINEHGDKFFHIEPRKQPSPYTYVVALYKCPVCSYLELHDSDRES